MGSTWGINWVGIHQVGIQRVGIFQMGILHMEFIRWELTGGIQLLDKKFLMAGLYYLRQSDKDKYD